MAEFSQVQDELTHQTGIEVPNTLASECIKREIATKGTISFAELVKLQLYGPHGYYQEGKAQISQDRGRDFSTSPEISTFFGATIGFGLKRAWEAMGRPATFDIVEIGGGTGAMAKSLLDWMSKLYPEFSESIRYSILEYGGGMIKKQQKNLKVVQ